MREICNNLLIFPQKYAQGKIVANLYILYEIYEPFHVFTSIYAPFARSLARRSKLYIACSDFFVKESEASVT